MAENNKQTNIPLLPIRGIILYPGMILTLDAMREFSINAVEHAIKADCSVFVVSQKKIESETPGEDELFKVGVVAKVKQITRIPNGSVRVVLEGGYPAELAEITGKKPFFKCDITPLFDKTPKKTTKTHQALIHSVITMFENYYSMSNRFGRDALIAMNTSVDDINRFSYMICANLNLPVSTKQDFLDIRDATLRLKKINGILANEIEILTIERDLHSKVRKEIDKNQREYYLREQLNIIKNELGLSEDIESEAEEYMKKARVLEFSPEIHDKITAEIKRFSMMPPSSHEGVVIRNYLDNVFELPWNKTSKEYSDLERCERILDRDHYGLSDVKKRILEHIAASANKKKSTVLCLVGPPGVGKTSVAASVAKATGRKFSRFSLGGVRDEADIRGHRKTYIGAMPGRIINALKQAGTKNPLILLDEIDKMAADFRGDPAAALLEVLDREQNHAFTDHYLEIPFDLSEVMFITTANTESTIPPALLDRMEIIELSGYTRYEKINIALKHLVPKQLEEYGYKKNRINITRSAIEKLIDSYTMEAGVRNLEREIGSLIRKAIYKINKDKIEKIKITDKDIPEYLGAEKYLELTQTTYDQPGIATGLAYTAAGGTILNIEVNIMDGSGNINLTGKLGEVMKESASAAISYIRSRASEYSLGKKFFKEKDIHIHVPEGAVPKDGPSAGITIATAIISAITGRCVKCNVAMTGEITIRGRVLAIGGLKEKSLAAHRHGIYNIIIPESNIKDLEEIPEDLRKDFNFIPVKTMDEVVKYALD